MARSLEKEAADERTSVNAEVNSIIRQHFEWHKKVEEFGIAAVPNSVFMSLLEGLDDETLARIGREDVIASWKEMAEFWFQDSSPEGIFEYLKVWSRFNPKSLTRITQEEGAFTVVLRHEYGPKWSIVMKNALQEFVRKAFLVEPRMGQGESVVTARFKVNPHNSPS